MKPIAILANAFALPGAGTMILGDYPLAAKQIGLTLLGGLTLASIMVVGPVALVGFLFIIGAWVWSIASAVRHPG